MKLVLSSALSKASVIKHIFPSVWTSKSFTSGEIQLVPYTTSISIVSAQEDVDGITVDINSNLIAVLKRREVVPQEGNTDHLLVPFWQIQITHDIAEANMDISCVKFATEQNGKNGIRFRYSRICVL